MISDLLSPDTPLFYLITGLCLFLGVALCYLQEMKKLNEMAREQGGKTVHWLTYYRDYPYASLYSALSSFLGYMMLVGMDELSIMTAIGVGFVGESISDSTGRRTKKALGIHE